MFNSILYTLFDLRFSNLQSVFVSLILNLFLNINLSDLNLEGSLYYRLPHGLVPILMHFLDQELQYGLGAIKSDAPA